MDNYSNQNGKNEALLCSFRSEQSNNDNDNRYNDNRYNDNRYNDNRYNDNRYNDNRYNDNCNNVDNNVDYSNDYDSNVTLDYGELHTIENSSVYDNNNTNNIKNDTIKQIMFGIFATSFLITVITIVFVSSIQ